MEELEFWEWGFRGCGSGGVGIWVVEGGVGV